METVVQLEPLSPDERTRNIDSLQRIYAEHIPRLEDILGLCASADVMALDDYLDIYYSPTLCLGGPLDSEVVWPIAPALKY
mmetsp:Transcript_13262/g.36637  ORF Transcript_13262/g.36637 Transcript_13262/m.36637 type:complete len:81 (-) Transcript_13262:298-540(-)